MSEVIIREVTYGSYGKCIEISNGIVDLCVTAEVGPRIIRYGFAGRHNEFCDDASLSMEVGDDSWRLMGGHRLWHSPEAFPRSYEPDNRPVQWEKTENGIKVVCEAQPWVQIKKEMTISLLPDSAKVKVIHSLTNKNAWPVELAAWALSVMAPGGVEIIPMAQRQTHFSDGIKGAKTIVMWAYSKMNDPRIYWGDKYVTLKQDPASESNIKIGFSNEDGWVAYVNRGHMFIKKYPYIQGANYPEHGCSLETFSINFMHEIESLSPLTLLNPDDVISHTEEWDLVDNVVLTSNNESEIDRIVSKHINKE